MGSLARNFDFNKIYASFLSEEIGLMSANAGPSPIILCCLLVVSLSAVAQQSQPQPKKIFTPEQQEYQQELKEFFAKRESLQAEAKRPFDAEMLRENAGACHKAEGTYAFDECDCQDAKSTYDFNVCYGKETSITSQNLKDYEEAISKLLALKYPDFPGLPAINAPGPVGSDLTAEQNVSEFDKVKQAWHSYMDAACTAALHRYGGGTGSPSFEMECRLRLMRDHMRELNFIYSLMLHK